MNATAANAIPIDHPEIRVGNKFKIWINEVSETLGEWNKSSRSRNRSSHIPDELLRDIGRSRIEVELNIKGDK